MHKQTLKLIFKQVFGGAGVTQCECHATARGSIPGGNGVKTEPHILRKGHSIGVSSLNDLAVDET